MSTGHPVDCLVDCLLRAERREGGSRPHRPPLEGEPADIKPTHPAESPGCHRLPRVHRPAVPGASPAPHPASAAGAQCGQPRTRDQQGHQGGQPPRPRGGGAGHPSSPRPPPAPAAFPRHTPSRSRGWHVMPLELQVVAWPLPIHRTPRFPQPSPGFPDLPSRSAFWAVPSPLRLSPPGSRPPAGSPP